MFSGVRTVDLEPRESTLSIPPAHSTITISGTHGEQPVDLQITGTFELRYVTLLGERFEAVPPLSFRITTIPPETVAIEGEFDILLADESYERLTDTLLPEAIESLWEEYVLEDSSILDEGALELRTALSARLKTSRCG